MRRAHLRNLAMDANRTVDTGSLARTARKDDGIVVFWIISDSACSECGEQLGKGDFLRLEVERPLCLACADLDHLVFLSRGDAALTRRASRYSALHAVVVRFSRARKRYERQGVLVEDDALERAERECLSDAESRRRARERAAEVRDQIDQQYVAAFAKRIAGLFPDCPDEERHAIAEHACAKHSGRVGRSAAAKAMEEGAVTLAVRAHVRHVHTPYDRLLASGMSRDEARERVATAVDLQLAAWRHAGGD
jgi:hypothetical protein